MGGGKVCHLRTPYLSLSVTALVYTVIVMSLRSPELRCTAHCDHLGDNVSCMNKYLQLNCSIIVRSLAACRSHAARVTDVKQRTFRNRSPTRRIFMISWSNHLYASLFGLNSMTASDRKRKITQITPHDSAGSLVFWHQTSLRNSNGITPNGGDKCRWG